MTLVKGHYFIERASVGAGEIFIRATEDESLRGTETERDRVHSRLRGSDGAKGSVKIAASGAPHTRGCVGLIEGQDVVRGQREKGGEEDAA